MSLKKKVIYVQYTSPVGYTILRTGARILRSMGWSVLFLGVRARGNADEISIDADEVESVQTLDVPPQGLRLKLHYLCFVCWTVFKVWRLRPSVVYGSEPNSALPLWVSRFVFRISTIYHEHDPPNVECERKNRFQLLLRRVAISAAELCIVPGQERADLFRSQYPKARVVSVWNGVDLNELTQIDKRVFDGSLVLWYQGAIVESQLPLALLSAMREVPETLLVFAGPSPSGQPDYLDRFLQIARSEGIEDRVNYLGVIPGRSELLKYARRAHVGLCLFSTPFRAPMVGASQKVFEYLASGLVLLAPDTMDWRSFIESNDIGVTCNTEDFSNLVLKLRELRSNCDRMEDMSDNGIRLIKHQWNYQTLFEPIVRWMERAARGSSQSDHWKTP